MCPLPGPGDARPAQLAGWALIPPIPSSCPEGSVRFLGGLVAPAGILPEWMTPAQKADPMKKTCFLLLCALLVGLAPSALADNEVGSGAWQDLLDQLTSVFAEIGIEFPPGGSPAPGVEPETGIEFPPSGVSASSEDPEIGIEFPPSG